MLRFIFLFLFSCSLNAAQEYSVEQLPSEFEGDWQVCRYTTSENNQYDCSSINVPGPIEQAFPEFDGLAFYRTTFTLSNEFEHQSLALYIRQIRDADKVYINGHLIGETGQFAPNFEKATLYQRLYPIPSSILKFNQSNELLIKLYNHARPGGMVMSAPVIDSVKNTYQNAATQESLLMIFVGMILLISAVQIFYYLAQPEHRENLLFAVLCVFESIYLLTYSQAALDSGINLTSIFRINILLFAILTVNFFLFVSYFFKQTIPSLIKGVLTLTLLMGIVSVTVLPIDWIYHILLAIQLLSVLILVPYYFYIFYQANRQKMPYAGLMSKVLGLYIITAIIDFAIDQQLLPLFVSGIAGLLSPIFLITVFIAITFILIHKHWLYFRHATYDYLTNCLRRSSFEQRLAEEIHRIHRTGLSIVVALIDIDNFKQINDEYNHLAGDKVLQEVVNRTRTSLRDFDLLGRYGGDEFIFAAEVSDKKDASQLLKRIHRNITSHPVIDKNDEAIAISITIGAVVAEASDLVTALQMIEEADQILVSGKVKQKGHVHI
ncbi:GGDEF domain-containing protein [Kangiella koreensis]|uniref:diguanylate cyclase n=1 Tax=Kangiella koreensis (strain DSM 16069 / JCM 12317 / KCTC 12182 / SW-125) TaxID=523791 RepID=C7R729_KANKD|nr:GGDEF domain-containing protein [Kangiella koreensis]ACV27485.1 diguanylate cyclase [Kangiella koreensis DSM 16069]